MPLYADNLDKRHHPSPVGAKGRTSRASYRFDGAKAGAQFSNGSRRANQC